MFSISNEKEPKIRIGATRQGLQAWLEIKLQ
jgi:hypothetical protein